MAQTPTLQKDLRPPPLQTGNADEELSTAPGAAPLVAAHGPRAAAGSARRALPLLPGLGDRPALWQHRRRTRAPQSRAHRRARRTIRGHGLGGEAAGTGRSAGGAAAPGTRSAVRPSVPGRAALPGSSCGSYGAAPGARAGNSSQTSGAAVLELPASRWVREHRCAAALRQRLSLPKKTVVKMKTYTRTVFYIEVVERELISRFCDTSLR